MLCPSCGRSSEFPSEAFGQWTRCPHCNAQVIAAPANSPPNPAVPFDHPPEKKVDVPDLAPCLKCGTMMLLSVNKCPHCGHEQIPRKRSPAPALAAIILLSGCVIYFGSQLIGSKHSGQGPEAVHALRANVSIKIGALSVRNDDKFDWRDVDLYLNGTPPFAYHHVLGSLRSGASTLIPLGSFVSNGAPFQAAQTGVSNVWVGSPGFDIKSFNIEAGQ